MGQLVYGKMLENNTTRTVTGVGTAYNLGAIESGLVGGLHVVGASPGDTIDVVIESDSAEAFSSPTTRLTFSQKGAIGSQQVIVVAAITDTWWRAKATIAGGGPSFTYSVFWGRIGAATAPPVVLLQDTYTGSDGALANADTGQTPVVLDGSAVRAGNRIQTTGANTVVVYDTAETDVIVRATVKVDQIGIRVAGRFTGVGVNGYVLSADSAVALHIYRYTAGSPTSLGSTASVDVGVNDVMELRFSGTSIEGVVNNVVVIGPVTDATHAGTFHGVSSFTTGAELDDLEVELN